VKGKKVEVKAEAKDGTVTRLLSTSTSAST